MKTGKTIIDLSKITSRTILHRALAAHLGLPAYYGRNLDALHDCLTEGSGEVELVLLNEELAPEAMRPYLASFKKTLADLTGVRENIRVDWK